MTQRPIQASFSSGSWRLERLLRPKEVRKMTALSRNGLGHLIDSGRFPKPMLVERKPRWHLADVILWMVRLRETNSAIAEARMHLEGAEKVDTESFVEEAKITNGEKPRRKSPVYTKPRLPRGEKTNGLLKLLTKQAMSSNEMQAAVGGSKIALDGLRRIGDRHGYSVREINKPGEEKRYRFVRRQQDRVSTPTGDKA